MFISIKQKAKTLTLSLKITFYLYLYGTHSEIGKLAVYENVQVFIKNSDKYSATMTSIETVGTIVIKLLKLVSFC